MLDVNIIFNKFNNLRWWNVSVVNISTEKCEKKFKGHKTVHGKINTFTLQQKTNLWPCDPWWTCLTLWASETTPPHLTGQAGVLLMDPPQDQFERQRPEPLRPWCISADGVWMTLNQLTHSEPGASGSDLWPCVVIWPCSHFSTLFSTRENKEHQCERLRL